MNTPTLPRHIVFALGLCALIATPSVATAAAFKWKDASGQTHYGEKPPADTAEVQQIEVYHCDTVECKDEEEQRKADQQEIQREVEQWLERRDEIKRQLIQTRTTQPVYVPIYVPPAAPWLFHPNISRLGLSKRLRHRNFRGHGLLGTGRKTVTMSPPTETPAPRTFSFPN